MAKLRKANNKQSNRAADPTAAPSQSNPTLLIGILLAVAVGVLFWVLTSQLQAKDQVMVAKKDIPAFSTLGPDMVEAQTVPKDSITKADVTQAQYQTLLKKGNGLVNRIELLQGQRINVGAVTSSSSGSLSAVKPDERLVAVNATFPGVVAGLARAGSVVDVYSGAGGNNGEDTGAAIAENVKVLALGAGAAAAANVRTNKQLNESQDNGGAIVAVLAVPTADAANILALPQVALALDPRYSFTANGTICEVNQCPTGGGASKPGNQDNPSDPASSIPQSSDQPSPDAGGTDAPAPDQATTPDQPTEGQ